MVVVVIAIGIVVLIVVVVVGNVLIAVINEDIVYLGEPLLQTLLLLTYALLAKISMKTLF